MLEKLKEEKDKVEREIADLALNKIPDSEDKIEHIDLTPDITINGKKYEPKDP